MVSAAYNVRDQVATEGRGLQQHLLPTPGSIWMRNEDLIWELFFVRSGIHEHLMK